MIGLHSYLLWTTLAPAFSYVVNYRRLESAHTWSSLNVPECQVAWTMPLLSSTAWWMPPCITPGQRCICPPGSHLYLISWTISLSPRSRQSLIEKARHSFLDCGTHACGDGAGSSMWKWVMDMYFTVVCASLLLFLILKLKEELVPDVGPGGPIKRIKVGSFDFGQIVQNKKN